MAINLEFVNYTIQLSQCAKKFLSKWIALFGVPTWLHLGQGVKEEFFEQHAIGTKVSGGHTPVGNWVMQKDIKTWCIFRKCLVSTDI